MDRDLAPDERVLSHSLQGKNLFEFLLHLGFKRVLQLGGSEEQGNHVRPLQSEESVHFLEDARSLPLAHPILPLRHAALICTTDSFNKAYQIV